MAGDGTKNLIPAKKGEIRNPKGRTKGARNRATIVREALEAIIAGSDQSYVDAITAAVIQKAMTMGDVPAFKELMDSAYGKIPDKVDADVKGNLVVEIVRFGSEQDKATSE